MSDDETDPLSPDFVLRLPLTGNCGTCVHWKPIDDDWYSVIRLTLREGEKEDDRYDYSTPLHAREVAAQKRYGECQEIGLLDNYEEHDEESLPLAYTKDASDYQATLYTQTAFGCPLWSDTPREPPA